MALYDRSGKPIEIERTAFVGFVEKEMVREMIGLNSKRMIMIMVSHETDKDCNHAIGLHVKMFSFFFFLISSFHLIYSSSFSFDTCFLIIQYKEKRKNNGND